MNRSVRNSRTANCLSWSMLKIAEPASRGHKAIVYKVDNNAESKLSDPKSVEVVVLVSRIGSGKPRPVSSPLDRADK